MRRPRLMPAAAGGHAQRSSTAALLPSRGMRCRSLAEPSRPCTRTSTEGSGSSQLTRTVPKFCSSTRCAASGCGSPRSMGVVPSAATAAGNEYAERWYPSHIAKWHSGTPACVSQEWVMPLLVTSTMRTPLLARPPSPPSHVHSISPKCTSPVSSTTGDPRRSAAWLSRRRRRCLAPGNHFSPPGRSLGSTCRPVPTSVTLTSVASSCSSSHAHCSSPSMSPPFVPWSSLW
mmetsp:Transcript_22115/g.77503  ORF Transcript_22115/g.77503 Transcript_22115/m.77503 type:complete len:231 (-) Transcript_22115:582-1274(-)